MLLATVAISAATVFLHGALLCLQARQAASRGASSSGAAKPAIEQQSEQYFEAMRLKVMLQLMVKMATASLVLLVAGGVVHSVGAGEVIFYHKDGDFATMPTYNICLALLLLTIPKVVESSAERRKNSTWCLREDKQLVDLAFSCCMAGFAVQGVYSVMCVSVGDQQFRAYRDPINSVRMLTCMAYMQPAASAVWTVLIAATYLTAVVSAGHESLFVIGSSEFAIGCLTCLSALIAERTMRSAAGSEVQARNSRSEVAAVRSLLHATCDAVVRLDDGLRVSGPHPGLAAFLFCQESSPNGASGRRHLAEVPFSRFLAKPEDLEEFERNMQVRGCALPADPEQPGMAKSFLVSMRDRLGNVIRVQISHVEFELGEGVVNHLIGLTESAEMQFRGDASSSTLQSDYLGAYASEPRSREVRDLPDFREVWAPPRQPPEALEVRDPPCLPLEALGDYVRDYVQARDHSQPALGPAEARDCNQPALPAGLVEVRRRSRPAPQLEASPTRAPCVASRTVVPGPREAPWTIGKLAELGLVTSAGSSEDNILSFEECAAQNFDHLRQSYLHHNLMPTTQLAKELSLVRAVLQWNYHVAGACCSFHAGIRLLEASASKMCNEACMEMNPSEAWGAQCGSCGLLSGEQLQGQRLCSYCLVSVKSMSL